MRTHEDIINDIRDRAHQGLCGSVSCGPQATPAETYAAIADLMDEAAELTHEASLCPVCSRGPQVSHVACNRAVELGVD